MILHQRPGIIEHITRVNAATKANHEALAFQGDQQLTQLTSQDPQFAPSAASELECQVTAPSVSVSGVQSCQALSGSVLSTETTSMSATSPSSSGMVGSNAQPGGDPSSSPIVGQPLSVGKASRIVVHAGFEELNLLEFHRDIQIDFDLK